MIILDLMFTSSNDVFSYQFHDGNKLVTPLL